VAARSHSVRRTLDWGARSWRRQSSRQVIAWGPSLTTGPARRGNLGDVQIRRKTKGRDPSYMCGVGCPPKSGMRPAYGAAIALLSPAVVTNEHTEQPVTRANGAAVGSVGSCGRPGSGREIGCREGPGRSRWAGLPGTSCASGGGQIRAAMEEKQVVLAGGPGARWPAGCG
jgi:hypothetical protein